MPEKYQRPTWHEQVESIERMERSSQDEHEAFRRGCRVQRADRGERFSLVLTGDHDGDHGQMPWMSSVGSTQPLGAPLCRLHFARNGRSSELARPRLQSH